MKKGVVLLITLFFIAAISILVLKNLDDTDTFLEKQNYKLNNTQVLIAIKNMQKELSLLLQKNKNTIDKVLENDSLNITTSIVLEELIVDFTLSKYEKVDINNLKIEDSKIVQELFWENDIFDYDEFESIYKEKTELYDKKVNTTKQFNDIINSFIFRTENSQVENIIKEKFGFISGENLYEVNINAEYISSNAKAYYILNNSGKVLYFDISFK